MNAFYVSSSSALQREFCRSLQLVLDLRQAFAIFRTVLLDAPSMDPSLNQPHAGPATSDRMKFAEITPYPDAWEPLSHIATIISCRDLWYCNPCPRYGWAGISSSITRHHWYLQEIKSWPDRNASTRCLIDTKSSLTDFVLTAPHCP